MIPRLNAETLVAAAIVGASPARANTRALSAGLVAKLATPSSPTAMTASTGTPSPRPSTTDTTAIAPSAVASVADGWASAVRPATVIPMTVPSP